MGLPDAILRELGPDRNPLAPERVLRLRLFYYYAASLGKTRHLWVAIHYGLQNLVNQGRIHRLTTGPDGEPLESTWYALPSLLSSTGHVKESLLPDFRSRLDLLNRWTHLDEAGKPLEHIIRAVMTSVGYRVIPSAVPFEDDDGKLELDVLTLGTPQVAVECKNVLSECFSAQKSNRRLSKVYTRLQRFFSFCQASGITAVLAAPIIDSSLYGWLEPWKGKVCRVLFQYVKDTPENQALVKEIHDTFRFSHVKVYNRTDPPPPHIARWFSAGHLPPP